MAAMDIQLIVELVLRELNIKDLVVCTLVNRSWSGIARNLLKRYHLYDLDAQIGELRCFELHKSNSASITKILEMRNLRSLTIHLPLSTAYPAAISSPTFPKGFCLSSLLSHLPHVRHLYINGPDARYRSLAPSGSPQAPFTSEIDRALLSLRDSRLGQDLPGLSTLHITTSVDLTWQALAAYLRPIEADQGTQGAAQEGCCGHDLRSLALANCTHLDAELLDVLSAYCPHLSTISLKKVDSLFSGEAFPLFPNLASLSLSIDLPSLPIDYFHAYQTITNLQQLSISSSKSINCSHLSHFSSIRKLVISGCSSITTSLPFSKLRNLREVSYLGQGLDVATVWALWQAGTIRKLTLDAASLNKPVGRRSSSSYPTSETNLLPVALQPFATSNLLSASLPSWVLAYLISLSPPSLGAISILGTVEQDTAKPVTRYTRSASCPYGWTVQEDCQYTPWGLPVQFSAIHTPGLFHRLLSWLRPTALPGEPQLKEARLPILPLPVSSKREQRSSGSDRGTASNERRARLADGQCGLEEQSSGPPSGIGDAPQRGHSSILLDDQLFELLSLPMPDGAVQSKSQTRSCRLTPAQVEWVKATTGGRIVRLEV